jgi:hypothetical protein
MNAARPSAGAPARAVVQPRAWEGHMRAAGPSQGANCAPSQGSEAAAAASVGVHQ